MEVVLTVTYLLTYYLLSPVLMTWFTIRLSRILSHGIS